MQTLTDTLASLHINAEVTFRNITMFPLAPPTGPASTDAPYRVLDEALASGDVAIEEVSDAGSVPELKLTNSGALDVLLMDGEELVGAKQNRVLNVTVLIAALTTTTIPVSCVERGRWSRRSAMFGASDRAMHASGRRSKMEQVSRSMRDGSRRSDQGEVWRDIDAKMARMSTHSDTSAIADAYEQHAARVSDYVRALPPPEGAYGAIFALDGRIVSLDLFDAPGTFRRLQPKLVRSLALDAIETSSVDLPTRASADHARAFLSDLAAAKLERYPAVALGEDLRIEAPHLTAAALTHDARLVHLTAFRT